VTSEEVPSSVVPPPIIPVSISAPISVSTVVFLDLLSLSVSPLSFGLEGVLCSKSYAIQNSTLRRDGSWTFGKFPFPHPNAWDGSDG
jgi:hypothetical protein